MVNQNRAVSRAFALRPIINAENFRRCNFRQRRTPDALKQYIGAHRQAEFAGETRSGFAAQCKTDKFKRSG